MKTKLLPIDRVAKDDLLKWRNDKNIIYPIMGFRFPFYKKDLEDWLESNRNDNGVNRVVFGIFLKKINFWIL